MNELARIFKSSKRQFDCQRKNSGEIVSATALATLLKDEHIVVGDWVEISPPGAGSSDWVIQKVLERKSTIFRNIPREQKKKVIAANVDLMMIVTSAGKPLYKRGLIDRYIARASYWSVPAIVIFNKMDLYDESEFDIKFESDRLQWAQVQTFEVSSSDESYTNRFLTNGMSELKNLIKDKTTILVGHSGVGKSKLISTLSEGDVELLSGDLGKVGKGAHTTTWAELVPVKDFTLIDSPGIRSMSLSDLTQEELLYGFSDIAEFATKCQFSSTCTHEENSKGCYFQKLDAKKREDELVLSRLDSFKRILSEVKNIPDWQKKS